MSRLPLLPDLLPLLSYPTSLVTTSYLDSHSSVLRGWIFCCWGPSATAAAAAGSAVAISISDLRPARAVRGLGMASSSSSAYRRTGCCCCSLRWTLDACPLRFLECGDGLEPSSYPKVDGNCPVSGAGMVDVPGRSSERSVPCGVARGSRWRTPTTQQWRLVAARRHR